MEDVAASKAAAERRNKTGKILQSLQNSEFEDRLTEKMDDSLFGDMGQTETQEMFHDFGGGVSKGPPSGGWPVFDPVSGKRLASHGNFTSVSPL